MKCTLSVLLLVFLSLCGCGGGQLAKAASSVPVPTPSNPTPAPDPAPPPAPTPTPQPTPPPAPAPAPTPVSWDVNELPPITGDTSSQANALNNLGHVAGYSSASGTFPAITHATLWVNGIATDLGLNTVALGINDSDQIVGYKIGDDGHPHAHLWPDDIDLPELSGFDSSIATGINGSGEIVGVAFVFSNTSNQAGFSWTQAGGTQAIPNCASASAINDAGQIVGILANLDAGICSSGTDFAHVGNAGAINNSGTAVGYDVDGSAWEFPNLNLGPTLATGINDNGWVVGFSVTPLGSANDVRSHVIGTSQPWFWSESTGLVPLPGSAVSGINRSGQISGAQVRADGAIHGVLLNPQF